MNLLTKKWKMLIPEPIVKTFAWPKNPTFVDQSRMIIQTEFAKYIQTPGDLDHHHLNQRSKILIILKISVLKVSKSQLI